MSGGSYDYACFAIQSAADTLRTRHPNEPHVIALAGLLNHVSLVMQDIEWADSGDTTWDEELNEKIRAVIAPTSEVGVAVTQAERASNNLTAALAALRALLPRAPEGGAEGANNKGNQ